jgi:hypothetical protein
MKGFIGRLVKEGNTFKPATKKDLELYNQFKSQLQEGAVIDMYIQEAGPAATLAQIAKIHAMIGVLSNHTGETSDSIKTMVKEKAGLTINAAGVVHIKSFGDCNKEELSHAIQAALEIGEFTNCSLH